MKFNLAIIACIFFTANVFAQTENKANKPESPADKIVQFWFVMIRTGPKQDLDSAAKAKLFEGHMANIIRLYNDGILKVAGPFGKNDLKWRGIFILDCRTKEEAEGYVLADPAVAAGLFAVDIVPWYGEPIGSFKKGKPEKTD
ncbi:MAG: YciI family protein [Ferruginibacter sp.]